MGLPFTKSAKATWLPGTIFTSSSPPFLGPPRSEGRGGRRRVINERLEPPCPETSSGSTPPRRPEPSRTIAKQLPDRRAAGTPHKTIPRFTAEQVEGVARDDRREKAFDVHRVTTPTEPSPAKRPEITQHAASHSRKKTLRRYPVTHDYRPTPRCRDSSVEIGLTFSGRMQRLSTEPAPRRSPE